MKAPTLDVDQAGLPMLPYARSQLLRLEQRRAGTGLPFLHDRVLADSTTTIDITASEHAPRIRIRSGAEAYNVVVFANGPSYFIVVTDRSGKKLRHVAVPAGQYPVAVAITPDGLTQYAVFADSPVGSFTSSAVTFTLYVLTSPSGTTTYTTLYSPPSGWETKVVRPILGGTAPLPAVYQFAASGGKCLLYSGVAVNRATLYGYASAWASNSGRRHYAARAIVLYFDGTALSTQTSSWTPGAPVSAGAGDPAQYFSTEYGFDVSVSADCSTWALVLNGKLRQEAYTLLEESHDVITSGITSRMYGPGFDLSYVRPFTFSDSNATTGGFVEADGVVRSFYWSYSYGQYPTSTPTEETAAIYDGAIVFSASGSSLSQVEQVTAFAPPAQVSHPHMFATLAPASNTSRWYVNGGVVETTVSAVSLEAILATDSAGEKAVLSPVVGQDRVMLTAGFTAVRRDLPFDLILAFSTVTSGLRIEDDGLVVVGVDGDPVTYMITPDLSEVGEIVGYSSFQPLVGVSFALPETTVGSPIGGPGSFDSVARRAVV